MNPTLEQIRASYLKACQYLIPFGWAPMGDGRFEKNGKLHDLSAADITKHKEIEERGLFVVNSSHLAH